MIDLVLQAASRTAIFDLLVARGLLDATTGEKGETVYTSAPGFSWCWWAGSGKLMTAAPVLDKDGEVTTPASFLGGFVMLCRIADASDAIKGAADGEQWARSKVAKFIKDNGSATTVGGFPCVTLLGVRMMKAADLFAWLAANNLPGHEWAGGNSI